MREFLARNELTPEFHDVRKAPVSADDAVALVRRHKRGLARKGSALVEVEIATAPDALLRKLFLGREGTLRAPTVSDGETVLSGFDEAALREVMGVKQE